MTKIVYNDCFGGFGLSKKAVERYFQLKGWGLVTTEYNGTYNRYRRDNGDGFYADDLERDDPILAQVVEELGEDANGPFAKLAIRELAPGTKYIIDEYDGNESILTQDELNWRIAR